MTELFRHVNQDTKIPLPYCIYVVAFHEKQGVNPFLLYMLDHLELGVLSFPKIQGPVEDVSIPIKTILEEYKEIQYIGQVIYGKMVFVFVKIMDEIQGGKIVGKRWFCLLDEILNHQYVVNQLTISYICVEFLFSNPAYYTLTNSVGNKYEIPYVGFLCCESDKQAEINYQFGPVREHYDYYIFEECKPRHYVRYALFGTTPTTENEVTNWKVKSLVNVTSLSWN